MKSSWIKVSSSNGITLLTLQIGMYLIFMQCSILTECHNRLVFCWPAIPWLQQEVDLYVYNHNTSHRRACCAKILPKGIPDAMFKNLELVSAYDFKVR